MAKRKIKVGLALGAGSARGLAHVGVLEVLDKEGIPIDFLAGTSAGALIGALYAIGKSVAEIHEITAKLAPKRLAWFTDLALPRTGLVKGRRIRETITGYGKLLEMG